MDCRDGSQPQVWMKPAQHANTGRATDETVEREKKLEPDDLPYRVQAV